jgi:ABC-type polysaccharide/polyol phosphate export permease
VSPWQPVTGQRDEPDIGMLMQPLNGDSPLLPLTFISAAHLSKDAVVDLTSGLRRYDIWSRLAFHEIRQRFHRSLLGPLWLTLSMGIMVTAMGLVFSRLFGQNVQETLPYIAVGIIFWGLLTSCINEGTNVFIGNESNIKNVPEPLSVHLYRMLTRNLIVTAFNMIIYVIVVIYFGLNVGWEVFFFIPGFILFIVNAAWMALMSGILSTRFRDIPQVIANLIQVIFFVTPVFWSPSSLSNHPAFIEFNPLYHLLQIVRAPLLGEFPTVESWVWAASLAVLGATATVLLYRRVYSRIAYWV